MAYHVSLTTRAQRDLAHLYGEIDSENSDAALKWYRGLKEAILSLDVRHGARRTFKRFDLK
jgi:hypothetical protein